MSFLEGYDYRTYISVKSGDIRDFLRFEGDFSNGTFFGGLMSSFPNMSEKLSISLALTAL